MTSVWFHIFSLELRKESDSKIAERAWPSEHNEQTLGAYEIELKGKTEKIENMPVSSTIVNANFSQLCLALKTSGVIVRFINS